MSYTKGQLDNLSCLRELRNEKVINMQTQSFHSFLAETVAWLTHGTLIVDLSIVAEFFSEEFCLKWTCDFFYLIPIETNISDILMKL